MPRRKTSVDSTTIALSVQTRERLQRPSLKGETYEEVLVRILEDVESRVLYDRQRRILGRGEFVALEQV